MMRKTRHAFHHFQKYHCLISVLTVPFVASAYANPAMAFSGSYPTSSQASHALSYVPFSTIITSLSLSLSDPFSISSKRAQVLRSLK